MTDVSGRKQAMPSPGSVVVVRDEEWLVLRSEASADGEWFVDVQGLTELVRDTSATFSTGLDNVEVLDPAAATVIGDDTPGYRRSRLWLEAMARKTAIPVTDPTLTVAAQGLADALPYQLEAVRKALDPRNLRPRILLADAVGLGKTIEIGMILSELVRRGRGDRILVVTPRHVLEQMQFELWTRFALPFVRLDSVGIQRIRQKIPGNRNPFAFYKRAIISIDTLKSDRYLSHLRKQHWDAVVIDESHNVTGASQNNRLARLLASRTDALILASATPHNGRKESFAELVRLLEPSAVTPDGELVKEEVQQLVIRRHRHSPEVASHVGGDWAERLPPDNQVVTASAVENEIARELDEVWLHPWSGRSPYSGENATLFPWTLMKAFLSSPAALATTVRERRRRLGKDLKREQQTEVEALERLESLAVRAHDEPSGKYDALRKHLAEIGVAKDSARRVVIFAERVATLDWLRDRLPANGGTVEARFGAAFRDLLHRSGWVADEPWTPLRRDLAAPVEDCGLRIEVLDAGHVEDRVLQDRVAVGRASFPNSAFSLERWRAMAATSAYRRARCLVAYDHDGNAVAASTVWSAGRGRPGLIEPLGAHRDHRGRGHGRAIAVAAAAALQQLGSSSATVCTRSSNVGGVAAYRSAGFEKLPEVTDFRRPA